MADCLFEANDVGGNFVSNGGGVHVGPAGTAAVMRSSFLDNEGKFGGAIAVDEGFATVDDCDVRRNDSSLGPRASSTS